MARAMVLIWVCFCVLLSTTSVNLGVNGLGMNWGTQASTPLHPSVVVQILKDNKINKVKLFDSDHWTVSFFAGTGIEVTLGIPNNQLDLFSDDYGHAKDWVKENVTAHLRDGGVNIRYIAVGNEPFLKAYNGSFAKSAFPALKNVQKALHHAGVSDKIKATIPQNADVYSSGTEGPSKGDFRADIKDQMIEIVKFLKDNDCPFMVNIYPFLSLYENSDFPVEFAFFDGGAKPVQDNNIQYTNMFDANLDTLFNSLKKADARDLKIVVGEIGWPTDGNANATVKLAKKFYKGLFKKLASNKGTPLYKGYIEVYLFSLTDENMKSIAPGNFERHWGIFRYDGQPKFEMDFSGQGQEKMPVGGKGMQYLPSQWCVFNEDFKDLNKVMGDLAYACSRSDCTSLFYGCTCSNMTIEKNISYAFNMYYQMNNQDAEACNFNGFAKISEQNLSHGDCLFPIAIQSAGNKLTALFKSSVLVGLLYFFALF